MARSTFGATWLVSLRGERGKKEDCVKKGRKEADSHTQKKRQRPLLCSLLLKEKKVKKKYSKGDILHSEVEGKPGDCYPSVPSWFRQKAS